MKVRLTSQWVHTDFGDHEGEQASELKTVVIDTEVDRKYDGSKTVDDVKQMFLQSHAPSFVINIMLQVTECVEI